MHSNYVNNFYSMLQIILFLKFDIVLLSSHALSKTLHLATDYKKSVTSIEQIIKQSTYTNAHTGGNNGRIYEF